jgi:HPt (histidine-containing phosphotransfer) domain-containing protein
VAVFDIDKVAEQLMLPVETVQPLAQKFVATYATFETDLAKDIDAGDFDAAARQAHSLKGITATLLVEDVSDKAYALEKALRAEDDAAWPVALADLMGDLNDLIASIKTQV